MYNQRIVDVEKAHGGIGLKAEKFNKRLKNMNTL